MFAVDEEYTFLGLAHITWLKFSVRDLLQDPGEILYIVCRFDSAPQPVTTLVNIYYDSTILITHGGLECGQGQFTPDTFLSNAALEHSRPIGSSNETKAGCSIIRNRRLIVEGMTLMLCTFLSFAASCKVLCLAENHACSNVWTQVIAGLSTKVKQTVVHELSSLLPESLRPLPMGLLKVNDSRTDISPAAGIVDCHAKEQTTLWLRYIIMNNLHYFQEITYITRRRDSLTISENLTPAHHFIIC